MSQTTFTEDDAGCWADDALGHEHLRFRLAGILLTLPGATGLMQTMDVVSSLQSEQAPDDFSDEDDALEILQDYTADGFVWQIDNGLYLRRITHEGLS